MAERLKIVQTKIPDSALTAFRSLARQPVLETLVAPKFAEAFRAWLTLVARAAADDLPKRRGQSARELLGSVRVTGGQTRLNTIRGYYFVGSSIAANEYGASIFPRKARKLAIPLPAALYPDGSPKRRGPLSWRSLGSFIYKSKKTGQLYIAYKGPRGLVLLYVLVDHARLREQRHIRNAYDRMQPLLYTMFQAILEQEIQLVYRSNMEVTVRGKQIIYAPNNSPPSSAKYANLLRPRYIRQPR